MDPERGLQALNIYYDHYGREELEARKHHASARCLFHSRLWLEITHSASRVESNRELLPGVMKNETGLRNAMRILVSPLVKYADLEGVRFRVPLRIARCYRNHIYPAEIHDSDSPFFRANLSVIDALLIDRHYDQDLPFAERGPWRNLTNRYEWLRTVRRRHGRPVYFCRND